LIYKQKKTFIKTKISEDFVNYIHSLIRKFSNKEYIPIENLYTKQIGEDSKNLVDEDFPSNLDAIFISHPHKDHFLGISFVNRTIPIYTGVVSKKIIIAFYKSTKRSIENNFAGLNWHTFRTGDILNIKRLNVVPFHVDIIHHSLWQPLPQLHKFPF